MTQTINPKSALFDVANAVCDRLRHEGFVHGFVAARDPKNPQDTLVVLKAAERAWCAHLASQEAARG